MNKTALVFLLGIKSSLERFGNWLMTFGAFGLFGISLVDSAGVPLPGGPDAVMIILSAKNHALMPLYALAATAGSTLGCTFMYMIARRAGAAALARMSEERRARIENLLGRYDMLAVMIPAVLPPPFPFKPFVLSAGVFKLKITRFITAIFIGRAARFLIEGWLAIRFGDRSSDVIKQHGLKVLLIVGLIALVIIAVQFYRSRRAAALQTMRNQSHQTE